jgi:exosortase N
MKWLLLLLYALLFGYLAYQNYFLIDASFGVGALLLLYAFWSLPRGGPTHRFAWLGLALLVAAYFTPTYSIRYLLLVVAVLWTIESLWGQLNGLILAILLLISPIFRFFSETFTFPIRLQLSSWVGQLLSKTGTTVQVSGNVLQLNGTDFVVEPACMGLQSVGLSLLMVIFFLIHHQRITQKSLPNLWSFGLLLVAFLLNIVSNLCRMLLLILFKIMPQNPLHDVVGLLCLVVYVGLPMAFFVSYIFNNQYFTKITTVAKFTILTWKMQFAVCILVGIVVLQRIPSVRGAGFKIEQIKTSDALVYVKPIAAFYSSEHSPTVCWRGSGYVIEQVRKLTIGQQTVYAGTLRKNNETLQTAWWFSNTHTQTISQLEWRWQMLKGQKPFKLINVTTAKEEDLEKNIRIWLRKV